MKRQISKIALHTYSMNALNYQDRLWQTRQMIEPILTLEVKSAISVIRKILTDQFVSVVPFNSQNRKLRLAPLEMPAFSESTQIGVKFQF